MGRAKCQAKADWNGELKRLKPTDVVIIGSGFAGISPEEQDQRLEKIERSRFFGLFRGHCVEGMMCDPLHKGNDGLVGWKLIGFPGPQLSYQNDLVAYYGKPYRVAPQSLSEILGHPVKGVEDETTPTL